MITGENLPDAQIINLEKQALNKELEYLLKHEVPNQWDAILQHLKVDFHKHLTHQIDWCSHFRRYSATSLSK